MTHVDTPESICRCGVARGEITPPVGIYHRMWGAATHDQATGVHMPLTATAMVLAPIDESNTQQQVYVAMDHCLLWAKEMEDLLDALQAQTGVAREDIFICFSHTHSAGLMGSERFELPGGDLIPPYLEELTNKTAQLILQARDRLAPATISYGTGRCNLAANRDFWDAESDQFVCGLNPEGEVDDTVLVGNITSENGTLATLVNYACHPTTLAWGNTLISPDYPGAMREVIEEATEAPCFFIQGASGDVGPREGFVPDPAVADRNGFQLGLSALSAMTALPEPGVQFEYTGPVVSGATIGTWAYTEVSDERLAQQARWERRDWTVELPYRDDLPDAEKTREALKHWTTEEAAAKESGDETKARDARAMIERQTRLLTRVATLPPGDTFSFPVHLCRMGDAFWLAVIGEHYNIFQRTLRDRFPGVPIVVATLANGSPCWYLPSADAYGKGLYQENASVLAQGALETLIEEISGAIEASLGS